MNVAITVTLVLVLSPKNLCFWSRMTGLCSLFSLCPLLCVPVSVIITGEEIFKDGCLAANCLPPHWEKLQRRGLGLSSMAYCLRMGQLVQQSKLDASRFLFIFIW